MNVKMFNQSKERELSFEGESVRLSNELRNHPPRIFHSSNGDITYPAKTDGFDIETCSVNDIISWLNNKNIKKSPTLETFVYRVLSVRFPRKFDMLSVPTKLKKQKKLIKQEKRNDPKWFGEWGLQNG